MEAIARHDFRATAEDELSFNRGDTLKVLKIDDELRWYRAELNGREGLVPSNYIEMKPHDWYRGSISRPDTETLLLKRIQNRYVYSDGMFVVRDSQTTRGELSISVKCGDRVQHFRILRDVNSGGNYYIWNSQFPSLNTLIEHHRHTSISQPSEESLLLRDMQINLRCRALYDFSAQDQRDLSFRSGDTISIKDMPDVNWWHGRLMNGEEGLFPATYVEIV